MVQKLLDDILSNLNILESLPNQTYNEISRLDKEQCDVLHMIEFGNFNACDGYKMAKRLQDIRLKRRSVKNTQEIVKKYKSTIDKYKSIKQSLESSTMSVGRAVGNQKNKKYTARVLDVKDDLSRLKSVNKSDITFRDSRYESKMDSLFKQIETDKSK